MGPAHQTAGRIEEGKSRVQALQELASAERKAGDLDAVRATLAMARDLAAQLEEGWNRFSLLSEIALYYLEIQDPEAARNTFAVMLMAAQASVDRDRRDLALVSLVTAQASAGAIAAATRTARG